MSLLTALKFFLFIVGFQQFWLYCALTLPTWALCTHFLMSFFFFFLFGSVSRFLPRDNLESPLDCKEIKPVNPKGNQPWLFIRRTDVEALILWPPNAKSQLFGKDPNVRKNWGQEEKGMTEDKMVGWHHWLNGQAFEQTLGDSEGQGCLGFQKVGHELVTKQQVSSEI